MSLTRRLFSVVSITLRNKVNFISYNQSSYLGNNKLLLIIWNYINPPSNDECVYRSTETRLAYEQHRQKLTTQRIPIKDYIISRYFKCPKSIERGWNIVLNNFPLCLSPEIKHLVMWISPKKQFSDANINDIIENYMSERDHHEYIYYRNRPERQSIPTVDHIQIFVRE